MTEKRFTAVIYEDYEKSLFFDNERKEQSLTDYEILNLLNELNEELESKEKAHTRCDELYRKLYDENEQLKKLLECSREEANDYCEELMGKDEFLRLYKEKNEQLKHNNKMLSMKMSEVYTKYRLLKEFSEDTNPNDAVKRVLSELMQITKEYR